MTTMVKKHLIPIFFPIFPYQINFFASLDGDNTYAIQANLTTFDKIYTLTSQQFSTAGVSCLTFDYYFLVDSTHRNELKIVLSDQARSNDTLIWSIAGVNIDNWKQAEAQIDQRGSFKVITDNNSATAVAQVQVQLQLPF